MFYPNTEWMNKWRCESLAARGSHHIGEFLFLHSTTTSRWKQSEPQRGKEVKLSSRLWRFYCPAVSHVYYENFRKYARNGNIADHLHFAVKLLLLFRWFHLTIRRQNIKVVLNVQNNCNRRANLDGNAALNYYITRNHHQRRKELSASWGGCVLKIPDKYLGRKILS